MAITVMTVEQAEAIIKSITGAPAVSTATVDRAYEMAEMLTKAVSVVRTHRLNNG